MSNDERQCDPDRKDWTDCQPSSAVLQNSRYFAASGAQDWAEQNEDIAEKGEGISDDIPVMGRNYTVSMTNKNELFNELKDSFGWSQNVKGGRHASDRFQHSVTDEIRTNMTFVQTKMNTGIIVSNLSSFSVFGICFIQKIHLYI